MDAAGQVIREQSVASTPEAISKTIRAIGEVERVGLEAGINSAWIARELDEAKLPVIVIDATHAAAALKTVLLQTAMQGGANADCWPVHAVTPNRPATKVACARMSRPPTSRTCPFLTIAMAS